MTSIQHLVAPKLPTTLENRTHVDLPGYDLWLFYVHAVYVVPTQLDVPKFEDALSRVLQLHPHASGQLRCTDGRWSIELTNTAVPVEIDYKLDMRSDSFLHGDWIIQDDLSSFLNQQPVAAEIINGSAPLFRLKLTLFDCETSIGISWHHSLGDAIMLLRLMHTLSQFYQGLLPKFAAPTFQKRYFPTPSHSVVAKFWPRMPHLHATRGPNERANTESRKDVEQVRWRIDNHDIEALRSTLSLKGRGAPFPSKNDCLIAYLIAVLNDCRSNPIQQVTNVMSYRTICPSLFAENVASNLVLDVPTKVPVDMAGIATALREALIQCREPDYINGLVALTSYLKLEAVNAGKPFYGPLNDSCLTVNSNVTVDWCSAHFGCPDGTRFHTSGVVKLNLRCFRSNPAKGGDGVWQPRQSVEISMGVPAGLKPKVLETLTRGVRYTFNNESAHRL